MRLATVKERMGVQTPQGLVDLERLSEGQLPADPSAVYERWERVRDWLFSNNVSNPPAGVDLREAGPPSPSPRQVFAIGLNYVDHANETRVQVPEAPPVFTKFSSSLAGPFGELVLPSEFVDWEAELVVVIGRYAHHVSTAEAWSCVAGLTIGQDYSERRVQLSGPAPQYSLGKSFPGFAATGPVVVSPDELEDPDDLEITCTINGEVVQSGRTSAMVFSVPDLIHRLSGVCPLLPGDLVFTGTPAGIGASRTPPRYLRPGDRVVTSIQGLGSMEQVCVAADATTAL